MKKTRLHRKLKWFWVVVGVAGLVDFLVRGDQSIANSVPVLFALSVAALAIGEWSAEEASD